MIELRDAHPGTYTLAKYDLSRVRVTDFLHDSTAIGALDDGWVSCQLTLTPQSSTAVLDVTLLDEAGLNIYQGTGTMGVHLRPLLIYPARRPINFESTISTPPSLAPQT